MAVELPSTRTIVEFWKGPELVDTSHFSESLPNVVEGQSFNYEGPDGGIRLKGSVMKISHVVFPAGKLPITYIDVEVDVAKDKTKE